MADTNYFGTYARFVTKDRDTAASFLGSNTIVGDVFTIESVYEEGTRSGWIVDQFNTRLGEIDGTTLDKVEVLKAKGWKVQGLLVFVAFTEEPKPGYYWGEIALIAYDPQFEDAFGPWIELLRKNYGNGIRPDLRLGKKGFNQVIESQGSWLPTGRHSLPPKEKGTAIVKSERSGTERLVDQARKGNVGCTIIGWVFILAVVALIVFFIYRLGFM